MKRMTKKDLEGIRQAHHIGDTLYSRNIDIENLVNEVEACWKGRKKLKGELKACQETMLSLSEKLSECRHQVEKEKGAVGCPVCPYRDKKPCWHCEGCSYK